MTSSLRPGRKYTYAELAQLRDTPAMADWAAKGYVWRQDLDGTMELVHYSRASGALAERPNRAYVATWEDTKPFGELPPIHRRTPQQRLAAFTARIAEDVKAGRVLSEDQMRLYVPGHRKGSEVTGTDVEQVARHFLGQAQAVDDETESRKVVRRAPSD